MWEALRVRTSVFKVLFCVSFFTAAIAIGARGETAVSRGWTLVAPGGAEDLCARVDSPGVTLYKLSGGGYRTCEAGAVPGEAGRGYWVHAADDAALSLPAAAADRPVGLSLKKGWNLIGNPFGAAISWDGRVRVNGSPINELTELLSLPYEYVTETGAYRTVVILQPGKGYAVHANEDCTLALPLPDDTGQGVTFEPVAASQIVADPETGNYVAGQVVALRAAGASDAQARSRAAALGFTVLGFNSYLGLYQIGLPAGVSEAGAAADLEAAAEFESAARHRVLAPGAYVPNDPPYQGGPAEQRWGFERVRAPQAWTAVVPVGPTVAVIDTGVDTAHADLSGKVANGADFIAAGGDGTTDPAGHGTHVAGVIAARGDNAAGMAGVCWGCDIMPVRVCDAGACPFFSVLNGVTYAANNGARVINISLETTAAPGSPEWDIFQNVIDYAVSTGAFVVAAAGNNGNNENTIPAALDGVFAASAVDTTDYPAAFANTSSIVDIYAPGVSIYSTEPGGAEGMRDGTSMSAAFVSGAAGLLAALSPTISNAEIHNTLRNTADAMVVAPKDKAGRLNIGAAAALFASPNSPPVVDALTLSSQDTNPGQTVSINVQASDPDGDALGYAWAITGGALSNGATPDTVWTAPATPGEYVLTVTVSDGKGGNATARGIVRSGLAGLDYIRIYPSVTTLKRGEIVQFKSFGSFNDGSLRLVQPHWELKNGLGVISSDGKFTATETGVETVYATLGRFSAQLTIGIETGLPAPALSPAAMTGVGTVVNLTNASFIVIGQLNGAGGQKDFVAITYGATPDIVHLASGGLFTYNQSNTPDSTEGYMGALGDLDANGTLDLVVATRDSNPGTPAAGVYVYRNSGAGVFTRILILKPAVNIFSVAIRDMDNNGTLDIVAGAGAATGKPIIYWNSGTNNIATSFSEINQLQVNTTACPTAVVAVGDINNDTYADIVRVCSTAAAEYALNTKNQTFGAGAAIGSSSIGSRFGMLADVDADDDLDFVALRDTGAVEGFAIFENTNPAGPAFGAPDTTAATWPLGSGSSQFDMADNNDDGDLDIFSAPNNATTNANIYENDGFGAFSISGAGFAANAQAIVTGDLDGGNNPDVLVAPENLTAWQNSQPNALQPPAPTNLTHEVGANEVHFEWDWTPGTESTSAALVTFDLEMTYTNESGVSTNLSSSINPERLGAIGHATRTANTFGYTPAIPYASGTITWKVYAVDNMFRRSAASVSDVIGCPVVSSLADSGFSSLRSCIDYANRAGLDTTITFDDSIAGGTIGLTSELPAITTTSTNRATIDGTGANITIDGQNCGNCSGLIVQGNETKIMGLTINRFQNHGIFIDGPNGSSSTIGGDRSLGQGNVIGNNGGAGVLIESASAVNVHGNAIGTNYGAATGTVNMGNLYGIWLRNSAFGGAVGNQIGDVSMNEDLGNTIAYNTQNGIFVNRPVAGLFIDSNQNAIYTNSIYNNGGVADKGILINDNQHGLPTVQPPQITNNVTCGSGVDLYNVEVTYTNAVVEQALIYFYRADNSNPAVSADNISPTRGGEGYKYLTVGTGTNAAGAITQTFTDVPFDSSNGRYLTAYRYNTGSAPMNSQGFSEFGNNFDMWIPALLACSSTCPGWTVTNAADSGNGSLRECMTLANSTTGPQTIKFGADYTITPLSELPALNDLTGGTTIDSDNGAGGYYNIVIDGQGAAFDGFEISSATNTIKNLTIINFNGGAGVRITGVNAKNNTVIGCKIGNDGAIQRPNDYGVYIEGGATYNFIGDTTAERNIISGNNNDGVYIDSSNYNVVSGNNIGLNSAGTGSIANSANGITLSSASYSQIGGTNTDEGNVISGNNMGGSGIKFVASSRNSVYGNIIGLDKDGDSAVLNENGIWLSAGSHYNQIGGITDATYTRRNILSGNSSYGIRINGNATYNAVQGNYIGTDKNGLLSRPNGAAGVSIEAGPSYNLIGGTPIGLANAQGNIIAGNGMNSNGIWITSTSGIPTEKNVVQGNLIGINASNTSLPNKNGILMDGGSGNVVNNVIGGDIGSNYNIIAGNTQSGINISVPTADSNVVWGNYIGVLDDSTTYRPNQQYGVLIEQAAKSNLIGSATNTSFGNVIAGNTLDGVRVQDAGTDFNTLARNRIYRNNELGINLVSNGNQNIAYPDITGSTSLGGSSYSVTGTSSCGAGCRVELFKVKGAPLPDYIDTFTVPARGEAYEYLGDVTTIAGGGWSTNTITISNTEVITATITDAAGNTSEYAINETLATLAAPCTGWQVTSTADSGSGTLRQCIIEANSAVGVFNTITFAVAGTITLSSSLPALTDPAGLTIDGGDAVTIDGGGVATDAFIIQSASNTIADLVIGNFASAAITIKGAAATGNLILSNYIGINSTSVAMPNLYGVVIAQGASDNTIGGTAAADANIISGNTVAGVVMTDAGVTGNIIIGNYIGLNAAGDAAIGNDIGIEISDGAQDNTIGGDNSSGEGNVISGNTDIGIVIDGAATSNNKIHGNDIGTNAAVTAALGNRIGIQVSNGASGTEIGAAIAGYGNVISGSTTDGIVLDGSGAVTIYGNFIGTDRAGLATLGNGGDGLLISNNSTGVLVGGNQNEERNLISDNGQHGIEINASSGAEIYGNYIGTIFSGSTQMPNGGNGIYITNISGGNIIGSALAANPPNIIAFNLGEGVEIDAGSDGNTLTQNAIHSNSGGLGINLNAGNEDIVKPGITNVAKDPGVFIYDVDVTITPAAGAPAQCNLGSPCTLEMFITDSSAPSVPVDPSGAGEAYAYANASYTMSACAAWPCSITWSNVDLTAFVALGNSTTITMTLTDGLGNTSEFSDNVTLPSDSSCPEVSVTSDVVSPAPPGSLRDCIKRANASGGIYNNITFDPLVFTAPGTTIQLEGALDAIVTSSVKIQNTTGNEIIIRGGGAGWDCFQIFSPGNATSDVTGIVIENLTIINCKNGIYTNDLNITTDAFIMRDFTINGNYIGTDSSGSLGLGNREGISARYLADSTFQNNVISGNSSYGFHIFGGDASHNNVITGNYIGTNENGDRISNGTGLFIENVSKNNRIGGTAPGEGNIISGNTLNGIEIDYSGTTGNRIIGNIIGMNKDGDTAIPNGNGISVSSGPAGNPIGGAGAGEGNLISGNTNYGIYLDQAQSSEIFGNKIGTDLSGNCTGVGNGNSGIFAERESLYNVIGGFDAKANTIACNGGDGITLSTPNTHSNSMRGNVLFNNAGLAINLVGNVNNNIAAPAISAVEFTGPATVYATGTACVSCEVDLYWADNINPPGPGPSITADAAGEAYRIIIGTVTASATGTWAKWNIPVTTQAMYLTANTTNILNPINPDSSEFANNRPPNTCPVVSDLADSGFNTLRDCITKANNNGVPVTITFDAAIANGTISPTTQLPDITADGVVVDGTTRNITISGAICAACDGFTLRASDGGVKNLTIGGFSTFVNAGIAINNGSNNTITGNKIGNDGTAAMANDIGVTIFGTSANNTIGGTTAATRNTISGNGTGILFTGAGVTGNNITGNYIGTNALGTGELANTTGGIFITGGASSNTIGGSAAGAGNLIARNTTTGVRIDGAATTKNKISRNSIYANTGLGIDLTAGGNIDIAAPTLTQVQQTGLTTFNVWGTNAACAGCTVELFRVDDTAASVGQDLTFAGEAFDYIFPPQVTTATGSFAFWGADINGGTYFTATVTDTSGNGNTSEFALNIEAKNYPPEIQSVTFDNGAGLPQAPPDGTTPVTVIVTATDPNGLADLDYAEIDMSPVNGPLGIVTLLDTGIPEAGLADDGIFAGVVTVALGTALGTYPLTATVYDDRAEFDDGQGDLEVTDGSPIVISVDFTPNSLPPDGITPANIEVCADDPQGANTIATVDIDLSPVNQGLGIITLFDSGACASGPGKLFTGTVTVETGNPPGTYTLTATAVDNTGLSGTGNGDLDVENDPPVVTNPLAAPSSAQPGQAGVVFSATVQDNNGWADIVSVNIDLRPIMGLEFNALSAPAGSSNYELAGYTIPALAPPGDHVLTITATDAAGATGMDTLTLHINGPPTVDSVVFTPNSLPPDGTTTSNIEVCVVDPEGPGTITTVSIDLSPVNNGLGIIALGGTVPCAAGSGKLFTGTVAVETGKTPGTYTLTATAVDDTGLSDTGDGDLEVENEPPVIVSLTVTPDDVIENMLVSIFAEVTDNNGIDDIDSVTVDLSTISGPPNFVLYDDGLTGGDTAHDGTFTFIGYTIPAAAPGIKPLVFTADDGTDTDTDSVNIRINTPMTIVSMSFSPDTIVPDGIQTTSLTIDIQDVDAQTDISTVVVDLSSIGSAPAVRTLTYLPPPAGANTYRYVLNDIKPQAGWPGGLYNPVATVTDIFGRQASASDGLTLSNLRPKPPVLQSVTALDSEVDITWISPSKNTDNSALTNLAGHKLYRRLNSGAYGAAIYVDATTAINTLILYHDAVGLEDFETYCYRATAFNASGLESDPSSEMCVTVYPPRWVYQQTCGAQKTGKVQPPTAPGFFNRPTDITTDNAGNIFVADTDNHRIQKFDKNCVFKGLRGGFGNTPGKFKNPTGITYNSVTGFLYVVDQYNRIQVFDTTDSLNVQPGQFVVNSPINITADPVDGSLYISQNIVDIFSHYTAAGGFIEKWTVNEPRGSDVDSAGNVYVASIGDHKIYKISGGAISYYLGGPGNGLWQFSTPYDIAIDKTGGVDTMFIADAGNNRIDVYDSSGNLINIIGSYGNNYGSLINPSGVQISPFGSQSPISTLLVADKFNQRIQEFGPPVP